MKLFRFYIVYCKIFNYSYFKIINISIVSTMSVSCDRVVLLLQQHISVRISALEQWNVTSSAYLYLYPLLSMLLARLAHRTGHGTDPIVMKTLRNVTEFKSVIPSL